MDRRSETSRLATSTRGSSIAISPSLAQEPERPILLQDKNPETESDLNLVSTDKKKDVVLLIEDEQDTADLIRLCLVLAGMSVVHAKNGRQAMDIINTILPPQVVLLDLDVPYISGFELLNSIRAKTEWEQVPVIVVSGDSYPGGIERMRRAGAQDYVIKSAGVPILLHRLRDMLAHVA